MGAFKKFFKLKTGREWDERFDEAPVPPKRDLEGNVLPADEGWYYYENKISLLASFLRSGPGGFGVGGNARQRDSDDAVTEGAGCLEDAPGAKEVEEKDNVSGSEDAGGKVNGKEEDISSQGMVKDDGVDVKDPAIGSSMECAILID